MKLLNSIYICIFTGTSWWSDDGVRRTRRRDSFSLLYIILICVCFIGVGSGCLVGVGLIFAHIMIPLEVGLLFLVLFNLFFSLFLSYCFLFIFFVIFVLFFQSKKGGG